ncbi:MAG: lipid asymmetry maintenance protein MlaB [Gammaproteobacteria bacterium]
MSEQIALKGNTLKVSGDVVFNTVNAIINASAPLLKSISGDILVDLNNVDRVSSAALALLMNWKRFAKSQHKNIQFLNVPDKLQSIAQVCGVKNLLS